MGYQDQGYWRNWAPPHAKQLEDGTFQASDWYSSGPYDVRYDGYEEYNPGFPAGIIGMSVYVRVVTRDGERQRWVMSGIGSKFEVEIFPIISVEALVNPFPMLPPPWLPPPVREDPRRKPSPTPEPQRTPNAPPRVPKAPPTTSPPPGPGRNPAPPNTPSRPGPKAPPSPGPTIPGSKKEIGGDGQVKQPGPGAGVGTEKAGAGTKEKQRGPEGKPWRDMRPQGDPNVEPDPKKNPDTTPKDAHVVNEVLVMPAGARADLTGIAQELGRAERKLQSLMERGPGGGGWQGLETLLDLLNLLMALLSDPRPGVTYSVTAPCPNRGQTGNATDSVTVSESADGVDAVLKRLDALALLVDKSQRLPVKTCGRPSIPPNNATVTAFEVM